MQCDDFLDNLPKRLRSPKDNLQEKFLIPGLKLCKLYRRNTAWFRQSAIGIYAPALKPIIENNSKLDMLVSLTGKVNKEIIIALEKTKDEDSRRKIIQKWADKNIREITGLELNPQNKEYQHHVLTYLLATKKIEIRFAITKTEQNPDDENLFHEKAGYMLFEGDRKLAFMGNFNESSDSILKHGERLHIFKSNNINDHEDIDFYINDINDQWENRDPYTEVYKVNEKTLDAVKEYSLAEDEILDLSKRYRKQRKPVPPIADPPPEDTNSLQRNVPHIPTTYKGKPFKMGEHQINALEKWGKNNFQGILQHATGSGKTITAIYGASKVAEEGKNILIIGVPYQSLADQWVEELEMFNLHAIKCYESYASWGLEAEQQISRFKTKNDESFLLPLVVVNKTLASEKFQNLLKEIDPEYLIFVGDECHRYASEGATKKLPEAKYRLGLSATPFSEYEASELANMELRSYFGDVCDEFSIADAMRLGVLCKYEYHPIPIHLSENEYQIYQDNFQKIYAVSGDSDSEINMAAVSEMNRAIGSAESKFSKLSELVNNKAIQGRTIIFCGDGSTEVEAGTNELTDNELKDKERVNLILEEGKILRNFFTSDEGPRRRREILQAFNENDSQCLISIRVLDEGIDVPGVETAIIMASTRNRRQFVQRRGRVLRKADNKSLAKIYDMVCLPPKGVHESSIVDSEIKRIAEMMDVCENKEKSINLIHDLKNRYTIGEDTLIKIDSVIDGRSA